MNSLLLSGAIVSEWNTCGDVSVVGVVIPLVGVVGGAPGTMYKVCLLLLEDLLLICTRVAGLAMMSGWKAMV